MLTVFNNGVGYPIANDDYYVRELASGYDEIVFNVEIRDPVYQYINEESVIRDRDQNIYLIKQIDAGEKTAKVIAQINIDDWKKVLYKDYSNNSNTVYGTVLGILPDGWNILDYSGVTKRRTIPTSETKNYNVTALEVLEQCTSVYEVRFRFDTKNKVIRIINPASYLPQGAFASRDLNLKTLNFKGKSDSLVTRLYASGADGLTFASINGGKDYVENYEYSTKTICAYWSDERYTDKQSLLEDATAKLEEMAKPSRSYSCDVLDLANTNPDVYGFEDFSLFNVITLVDDAKEVRTNYQVVERWTYPYYPVKNKVVLSTSTPNIQSAIAQVVSAISNSTSGFQTMMVAAIENATNLITGNSGGYLILHDSNDDGTPDELLIMNTPDIATATKVWRWNQAGLGYSSTGYNGQFELGMTMDGAIVANFITSGILNADIIRAGKIQDTQNKNYWDLITGDFKLSATTQVGNSTVASASDVSSAITTAEGYADSAISSYDTELDQEEVFNKLTDNKQNQGIILDNGYLYINGTYIQANTIGANALTVEAKESLVEIHKYTPADIVDDINNWEWRSTAEGTVSIVQIGGENCLALDGTSLNAYNSAYYAQTQIEVIGKPTLTIKFKMRFSANVTIAQQRRWFIYYYNQDTGSYVTNFELISGTFEKDTWYDYTFTWTLLGTSDATKYIPKLGIYHIPGTIMYIKDFEVSSTMDSYTTASMDFTVNGLNLAFEEAAGTHNYIPYDYLTNIYRYTGRGGFTFPYFATIDGKTYIAFDADGVTTVTTSDTAKLPSDFLGQPTINVSFKLRFDRQFTCSAGERIIGLAYNDKYGDYHTIYRRWTSATTFEANTDYSFSFSFSPSYDALSEQYILFYYHADVITYFTDLKMESTETSYNSAALKVSAEGLSSIVQSGNVVSSINQSAESVQIRANKIDLAGDLSLRGDFKSYDPNDQTEQTYAFMDSGNLSFYANGLNLFTISSTAILGSYAGIFFGDVEDPSSMADYTNINQHQITTPFIYQKGSGVYSSHASDPFYGIVSELPAYMNTIWVDSLSVGGQPDGAATTHYDYYRNSIQFDNNVYNSSSSVVFVSDKRKKRSIKDLAIEKARSFIMALKPRKFKFIKDISTSDRYHHGFIAQEVKDVMPEDWGLYVENLEKDFIGLRYDEIIADLVKVVQDQQSRIEELERRLDDITNIQS